MLLKRRAMMFKHARLPAEYQEVEWLKGNGTSGYISLTNSRVNENYYIKVRADLSGTNGFILGVQERSSNKYYYFSVRTTLEDRNVVAFTGTSAAANLMTFDISDITGSAVVSLKAGELSINDEIVTGGHNLITFTKTPLLFARSIVASPGREGYFDGKIYEFEDAYDTYAMCYRKSDSKPGIYGLTHNVFLPAQGGITAGPHIV